MDPITCPVCGTNAILKNELCASCNATPRQRALALGVLLGLKLREKSINTCKMDKSRTGIGISDWFGLAAFLANRFAYTNTFFHKFPMLDISNPPDVAAGQFEFLTCSDVLEHVLPPVGKAFDGLFKLLRPGGVAVISVPIADEVAGIYEKYPNLNDFVIAQNSDGTYKMENITVDGRKEVFQNLKFHGGPGSTLELRVFSWDGFITALHEAGFEYVESVDAVPELGVPRRPFSGNVVLARKPT